MASDTFRDPCPVPSSSTPLPATVRPVLFADSLDNRECQAALLLSLLGEQAALGYPQPALSLAATQGNRENH